MKCALRWSVVLMLATTLVAQTAAKKPVRKAAAPPAATAEDVQALRDALAAQQRQIQQLQQQLQQTNQTCNSRSHSCSRPKVLRPMLSRRRRKLQAPSTQQNDTVVKLSSDMADVKTTLTNNAVNTQDDHEALFRPRRRDGPPEDER